MRQPILFLFPFVGEHILPPTFFPFRCLRQRFVVWPLELVLGTHNPCFVAWPLELGLGTHNPRFVAWPLELGLGTHNPRFVAWPLELKHLVVDVLQADALNRSSWCDCGNGGCPRCNLAVTIVLIKCPPSVSATAVRILPLSEERGVHIMQLWCKKEVQYAIDCAPCPQ